LLEHDRVARVPTDFDRPTQLARPAAGGWLDHGHGGAVGEPDEVSDLGSDEDRVLDDPGNRCGSALQLKVLISDSI
jgi:hypothetical protein